MQADRKEFVARGRIVDFGDQCVAQAPRTAEPNKSPHPPMPPLSLSPATFRNSERRFDQNGHAVIEAGE